MTENNISVKDVAEEVDHLSKVDLQEILRGNTFKIYWYLLSQGEAGTRELQRKLGFSSPNVAAHHLKKLANAGLIQQNPIHGKYEIQKEVRTGVLSLYTRVGKYLIPQNLFLLTFFFSMALCYFFFIIIPRGSLLPEDILFFTMSITGMAFFIQQTQKIWGLKPL